MNFLSHFYNEIPCNNACFVAGVILPDILSNYSSRNHEIVKIHINKMTNSEDPDMQMLTAGVKRHYAVDEQFHGSYFFDSNTAEIEAVIKNYEFQCFEKRLFAFSHVMLELMLDRKILLEDATVCDQFYAHLNTIELPVLEQFIGLNTKTKNPAKVAGNFDRFRSHRFLYEYVHDDVLVNILGGINRKIGNPDLTATDKINLTSVIHDIEKVLFSQKFPKFKPH